MRTPTILYQDTRVLVTGLTPFQTACLLTGGFEVASHAPTILVGPDTLTSHLAIEHVLQVPA
jgi:hypothetical protein